MNKNQWSASSALFFLLGIYLWWISSFFMITPYSSDSILIINRLYSILTLLSWFGFLFCQVNGYLQKTPAQEWAEVELAKHDFKFNIELSEMPIKKREAFLEGYYKTLMNISKGKKTLGENVEETKRRVLENVKKEDSKKK